MSRQKTETTARIPVVDQDGHRHTVIEETSFIDSGSLDSSGWIEGLKEFRLADTGERLNRVDADTFETIDNARLHLRRA